MISAKICYVYVMFINLSDVDLDASMMKAEIKYENKQLKQKHIPKGFCINALCQYVCVCA